MTKTTYFEDYPVLATYLVDEAGEGAEVIDDQKIGSVQLAPNPLWQHMPMSLTIAGFTYKIHHD